MNEQEITRKVIDKFASDRLLVTSPWYTIVEAMRDFDDADNCIFIAHKIIQRNPIKTFEGKFDFLSNFFSSIVVWKDSDEWSWPTSEHIYQAEKTVVPSERVNIHMASTPGKAKRLGRKVTLRKDWDSQKELVMLNILRQKFFQNPGLTKRLVNTGSAILVEGNTWHDNYWGNCRCDKCYNITGQNTLGNLLMYLRSEINYE